MAWFRIPNELKPPGGPSVIHDQTTRPHGRAFSTVMFAGINHLNPSLKHPYPSLVVARINVRINRLRYEAHFPFPFIAGLHRQYTIVEGAEFWVSDESPGHGNFSPETLKGGSVRLIFTVADPDAMFARAVATGATQVHAVAEEHGWRVGRIVDPFGHHWEIGRPVKS